MKKKYPDIKYFVNIPNLKNYASFHEYRKGQEIFYKDHLPYGLFVLLAGEVEIIYDSKNSKIIAQKAFLGFDSFMNDKPYSVTAKAQTDCQVYFLSGRDYNNLVQNNGGLLSGVY